MNLDKHELKVLAFAGALVPCGQPVKKTWLARLFDRPAKLQETIDKLRIGRLITFDPYSQELRLLARPILQVLNEFSQTPELFTSEKPLDAILADVLKVNRSCEITSDRVISHKTGFAPMEPKPPDPPPDPPGNPSRAHAFMPLMPIPMPRDSHVHVTCNSEALKQLHGHEHDVGELAPRTTEQILSDVRHLCPDLSPVNLDHWRARIEREDAALVNAIVRQARLQRRQIRNLAAWMNACYLKAVNQPDPKP